MSRHAGNDLGTIPKTRYLPSATGSNWKSLAPRRSSYEVVTNIERLGLFSRAVAWRILHSLRNLAIQLDSKYFGAERAQNSQAMDLTGKIDLAGGDPQPHEESWDRQPNETSKAYRAFCIYRDAHEARTFEFVAQRLQCSNTNVRRWAKKWKWVDRTREFDIYVDRIEREALRRERLAMKKRMARQGIDMQVVAAEGLAELQRLINNKEGPLRLTATDIARLAETGGKLERYARGEEEDEYGIFEIRVHIDNPPAESAEDLSAAKAAVEAALRGR